jgi:general stress protein YciG
MAEKKGERKSEMTVEEAGRKGGEETAKTHGKEFYEEIGHKGGEKTAKTHGKEFYEEIGHKGGEKGGQRVRKLIEEGKEAEEKK